MKKNAVLLDVPMALTLSSVENSVAPVAVKPLDKRICNNLTKLRWPIFVLPLFLGTSIVLYLYRMNALSAAGYIKIQTDSFFFLNAKLSQYAALEYNLTQFGDALIFLSFLTLFIIYAPKMWESLMSASIVSALLSCPLKTLFAVPRPAAVFDNGSFAVIGKALCGHNSLPSGHSITIFSVLTVLMYAFIPQKMTYRVAWFSFVISIGLILAFTRVALGAHYPLDVIIGGIIGYISGLVGIFISRKYKIWAWIGNKKYYPVLILVFVVCCVPIIGKIIRENLVIFYLSLVSLVLSIYKITNVYVKK